jgi:hypothetical protein
MAALAGSMVIKTSRKSSGQPAQYCKEPADGQLVRDAAPEFLNQPDTRPLGVYILMVNWIRNLFRLKFIPVKWLLDAFIDGKSD